MNGLLSVVRKEFRHIFRDRVSLLLLFLMPAVILLLFGYALSFDVREVQVQVFNPLHDAAAEQYFARIEAHPKLRVSGRLERIQDLDAAFWKGHNRAVIAAGEDGVDIFLDGTISLISIFTENLLRNIWQDQTDAAGDPIHIRYRYNPTQKREYMPVPGLVLMIFILISSIILGTSINKEKVRGTFRLLRLSSLSDGQIILGKSIPYFLISLLHVGAVMGACAWFGIRVCGNYGLFAGLCLLYCLCCLSFGLLIASWLDRPLDVLILCWVVLFIPNVFLSGFIYPVSAMEGGVRMVAELLPGTAFISAFRNIAYKGTGLAENLPMFVTLLTEFALAAGGSFVGFRIRRLPQ